MVYRKPHLECDNNNCQSYSAYIRVQKKWLKAGEYNSICKTFTPSKDVRTYDQIINEDRRKQIENNPYLKELVSRMSKHSKSINQ